MPCAMNNQAIINLQNISKKYIQGNIAIEVLKDINLAIFPGQMIAIVGASGSGKSTLLHIAGLLDTASKGAVEYNFLNVNEERARMPAHLMRLRYIGFIYQSHNLLKDFSARENVAMPMLIAGGDYNQALSKADELLDMLLLKPRKHNMPGELSGGEQQRVAIARSLINQPKLILADEPTGNLDPSSAEEVFALFLKLASSRQVAVVMVTHNHNLAQRMHKVYELKSGQLELVKT